jgi:hypothetical protein
VDRGQAIRCCLEYYVRDVLNQVLYNAVSILMMALFSPIFSTGFFFNGPKYDVPAPLSGWFGMHYTVYTAHRHALESFTLLSLACLIFGWAWTMIFNTLTYLSLVVPAITRPVYSAFNLIQLIVFVLLIIPSIVALLGWWCWWIMLFVDAPALVHILEINEEMVEAIEGNSFAPGLLSKMVHVCFGKLF